MWLVVRADAGPCFPYLFFCDVLEWQSRWRLRSASRCCLYMRYCSAISSDSCAEGEVACVWGSTVGIECRVWALSWVSSDCSCFRLFSADASMESASEDKNRRSGWHEFRASAREPRVN